MNRVAFVVLIFLLKLLSGGSFITRIRRKYGQDVVSLIHKVDKLIHRHVKLTNDIAFLKKYFDLHAFPTFVRFRTANQRLRSSTAYTKSQRLLLRDELRSKHRDRGTAALQLQRAKSVLFNSLAPIDVCCFKCWLSVSASKYNDSVKLLHNKKLSKL